MRRKDRAVTDFGEILKIVDECEIMRLGLPDGELPYIVPVNFAYRVAEGRLELYIHGAMAGRKYELMRRSRRCSFEMDVPLRMECIPAHGDVTMRYKSVMGTADIAFLSGEERQRAIDEIIMARHPETRLFAYNRRAVAVTAVARLTVTDIIGKANLPSGAPDLA